MPQRGGWRLLEFNLAEPVPVCVWERDGWVLLDNGIYTAVTPLSVDALAYLPLRFAYANAAHRSPRF